MHLATKLVTLMSAAGIAPTAMAADHVEAPIASADPAADITDFYAWHEDGLLTAILNVAGLSAPGEEAVYDEDVLYIVSIDNTGDYRADINIRVRFGQDDLGSWGVRVENLPGTGADVIGPVENVVVAPGGQVYAGLRDDPFFFDLDGYLDVLSNGALLDGGGNLYFDSGNDSFAGTNVTTIALEMDLYSAADGAEAFDIWATTLRISE